MFMFKGMCVFVFMFKAVHLWFCVTAKTKTDKKTEKLTKQDERRERTNGEIYVNMRKMYVYMCMEM